MIISFSNYCKFYLTAPSFLPHSKFFLSVHYLLSQSSRTGNVSQTGQKFLAFCKIMLKESGETLRCAGALCAQSNFIGACLGAKYGIEDIPIKWFERVEGMEQIIENSLKCFANHED